MQADLFALDLGERFDLVIGGSHFVDDADPDRRAALYATCARHLRAGGAVLLERYDPAWAADPQTYSGTAGPVDIAFEGPRPGGDPGPSTSGRTWTQPVRRGHGRVG